MVRVLLACLLLLVPSLAQAAGKTTFTIDVEERLVAFASARHSAKPFSRLERRSLKFPSAQIRPYGLPTDASTLSEWEGRVLLGQGLRKNVHTLVALCPANLRLN